jgi:hypothetical protein
MHLLVHVMALCVQRCWHPRLLSAAGVLSGLLLCRMYILPDTLNLDTLLVNLDQPKIRPKRPERPSGELLPR